MVRSRVLVAIACAVLVAMIGLDWIFPTPLFYSPYALHESVSKFLLFKKTIEISFSTLLITIAVVVLRGKESGKVEKLLACGAIGVSIGFWLHRDLLYLLSH